MGVGVVLPVIVLVGALGGIVVDGVVVMRIAQLVDSIFVRMGKKTGQEKDFLLAVWEQS